MNSDDNLIRFMLAAKPLPIENDPIVQGAEKLRKARARDRRKGYQGRASESQPLDKSSSEKLYRHRTI